MASEGISPAYGSMQWALRAVAGGLGPALVPPSVYARLLAFADQHPRLGQTQYLECRLGQGGPTQIDLLVSAATTFERASLGHALAASAERAPELWPIRRFVEAWSSPSSPLHRTVPVAWLEFDHMEQEERPIANVGVCLAPAYIDPWAALPGQPAADVLAMIAETLRVIRRDEPGPAETEFFRRCLDTLPEDARWIHLSVMAARTPLQLKLYGAFSTEAVLPYLREVGWAGDPAPVAEVLQRYCPWERTAGTVYVDLPVTGMHDPARAGLGIVFTNQQLSVAREHDPARRPLLDQLVADGLCAPDEREALVQWALLDGVGGGASLAGDGEHAGVEGSVRRWFDVKLAHLPDAPLLCKAYLGFLAQRLGARGLRTRARDSPRSAASPAPAAAP